MSEYDAYFLPEAHEDLYQIIRYIAQELNNPNAAKKLHGEMIDAIHRVQTFPLSAPPSRYAQLAEYGIRQLQVKNYSIMYYVDDPMRSIVIVYVKYSKQDFSQLGTEGLKNT